MSESIVYAPGWYLLFVKNCNIWFPVFVGYQCVMATRGEKEGPKESSTKSHLFANFRAFAKPKKA